MKRIKFLINTKGVTTIVDAEGFGLSCTEATAALESRLGRVDESSRAPTGNMQAEPEQQFLEQG